MIFRSMVVLLTVLWCAAPAAQAERLVYLTEDDGAALLLEAEGMGDYFKIASYLETEQILTFCGPATIAAVLNSLDVERPAPVQFFPWRLWTQNTVFTPENQEVKPHSVVERDGMVLEEIGQFFRNLGVSAEHQRADTFDLDELRTIVRDSLADPDKRLVANYSRRPIQQAGDGHISPVAAYNAETDRVLILDVARYKYPPAWLTISDLHDAMRAIDPDSGASRGLVIVTQ